MSEFKECDRLLDELTPTDESTIAGGSGYYGRKRHGKRRRRRHRKFNIFHFLRKYRYGY